MHRIFVYVAKQRRLQTERVAKAAAERRDRIARVQVSDEVWAAFRVGLRTTPVNVALGELVRREVGRKARRSARDAGGIEVALADAREVADELSSLIARLERTAANDLRSGHSGPSFGTEPPLSGQSALRGEE
jgi:hypothetical protein